MIWSWLLIWLLVLLLHVWWRYRSTRIGWDSVLQIIGKPPTLGLAGRTWVQHSAAPARYSDATGVDNPATGCGNQVTAVSDSGPGRHIVRFTPTPAGVPPGTVYGLTVDKLYMGECEVLPLGDEVDDPAVVCFVRGGQLYVVDAHSVVLDWAF